MNPRLEWEGAVCSNCRVGVARKLSKGEMTLRDGDRCGNCGSLTMQVVNNPTTIANIALAALVASRPAQPA